MPAGIEVIKAALDDLKNSGIYAVSRKRKCC